jgi:dTDP-glucose 4,6-dehydratase/UDP-glucose 4-epimerase
MRVKDARQTFLGYWLRQIVAGEEIAVFGDGLQKRDFNYVDDAVDAFLLAATRDEALGKVYNLGDSEVVSLLDLAQKLVELNGSGSYRVVPFPEDRKAIDIGDYYGDFARIKEDIGWEPRVDLDEGLRRSIDFYREQGDAYWV